MIGPSMYRKLRFFNPHISVCNFWHVRAPNGMLYYGLDYLKTFTGRHIILCRQSIFNALESELPSSHNHLILSLNLFEYCIVLCCLILFNKRLYSNLFTPSCHPIPFLPNNTVVLHDPFPFTSLSPISIIRTLLLFTSLYLSDCSIAYINLSNSYPFVKAISKYRLFQSHNIVYLPNIPPCINFNVITKLSPSRPYKIGLCGTNSSKKNYHKLISCLTSHCISASDLEFIVFGFETPYISSVRSFSPYCITILDSVSFSFESFLSSIHALVNVSYDEGYCRPIAAATQTHLPVLLLDTPVLREFYSASCSVFFSSINKLVLHLNNRIY
jgi:hypothetical protein